MQYGNVKNPIPGVILWEVLLDAHEKAQISQTPGVNTSNLIYKLELISKVAYVGPSCSEHEADCGPKIEEENLDIVSHVSHTSSSPESALSESLRDPAKGNRSSSLAERRPDPVTQAVSHDVKIMFPGNGSC